MGKKSSSPPNVSGAAQIEGEFARETARDVTYADRPDQYNPFGSLKWQQTQQIDPATGERVTAWTQVQDLSEDSKSIYNPTVAYLANNAELAQKLGLRAADELGQAPDWAQFGEASNLEFDPTALRSAAEDAAYQKSANRLNSRFDSEANDLEIKLRNQGLAPGDQAYDAQMAAFTRSKNDAFEQARLGATAEGRGEASQLFDQQLASTEFANALRSGNIEEYLAKRRLSLSEAQALDPTQGIQDLAATYTGGSGG